MHSAECTAKLSRPNPQVTGAKFFIVLAPENSGRTKDKTLIALF
jgi:hypothetical protein